MRRHLAWIALSAVLATTLTGAQASADQIWQVRGGQTTFSLNVDLLRDLDISVTVDQDQLLPPIDPYMEAPNWSFPITANSDLTFRVNHGVALPGGIMEGAIRHSGAFVFTDERSGRQHRMTGIDFEFIDPDTWAPASGPQHNPLYILDDDGSVVLDAVHSMFHTRLDENKLDIFYLNLRINEEWANAVGRPDLAGWVIGIGDLAADLVHVSGVNDGQPYVPNFGAGILDVKLGFLDSLQQVGRLGSQVSLASATTSCNVGTVDVPWLAPMDEDHPLIHQSLYRLKDGRFEQIGLAWLKHGFFALSNDQCTPCQNPSNGTFLGVGCSDTYGVFNNSDRRYLGPQVEVDPFAGTWECTGSHFALGVPDCSRRHGSNGHNALEHRIVVNDSDLGDANADYFYEAYYIVRGDESRDNNWGSKQTTMTLQGSTWDFNDASSLMEGPALYRWGDKQTFMQVPDDGKVLLAATATDLGGGMWNYEYALLNYDSDREIRSFSIPVTGVANISNIGFHDVDDDAGNDWQVTVDGNTITWATDEFGTDPDAPALYFGQLMNFRFDAEAGPVDLDATLGIFKPGTGTSISGSSTGPQNGSTGLADAGSPTATALRLVNRPNPMSTMTSISFDLSERTGVKLGVYDAAGRLVKDLANYTMLGGEHQLDWDGTGLDGRAVASGIYYARLKVGDAVRVRPMVVVR